MRSYLILFWEKLHRSAKKGVLIVVEQLRVLDSVVLDSAGLSGVRTLHSRVHGLRV